MTVEEWLKLRQEKVGNRPIKESKKSIVEDFIREMTTIASPPDCEEDCDILTGWEWDEESSTATPPRTEDLCASVREAIGAVASVWRESLDQQSESEEDSIAIEEWVQDCAGRLRERAISFPEIAEQADWRKAVCLIACRVSAKVRARYEFRSGRRVGRREMRDYFFRLANVVPKAADLRGLANRMGAIAKDET